MSIGFLEFFLSGEGGDAKKADDFPMSLELAPSVVFHWVSTFESGRESKELDKSKYIATFRHTKFYTFTNKANAQQP